MPAKYRTSLEERLEPSRRPRLSNSTSESEHVSAPQRPSMSAIQRARVNPESLSGHEVLQLQSTIGNRAVMRLLAKGSVVQRDDLNSAKISAVQTGATVAKTPNNFGAARFKTRAESVDGIDISDIGGDAGSLSGEDVAGGVRIDQQGDFHEDGKTYYNIQAQANDPTGDLRYPLGTRNEQKGTSIAEVHIDNRLPGSTKEDVRNRTLRLLKSSIYTSMGDRTTYPRPVYKIQNED